MKMSNVEKLPDGWIRKESRSRPNKFYYFNTQTGKTQWDPPSKPKDEGKKTSEPRHDHTKVKTSSKNDSNSKSHSSDNRTRTKIDEKSKELKKRKSKTPAQDRLQKLVDTNSKAVIDSIKVAKSTIPTKSKKSTSNATASTSAPTAKKVRFDLKSKYDKIDSVKSNGTKHVADDDIPALFPRKTPAQERLKSLQNKLSNNESRDEHDAAQVFGDTFGIESGKPAAVANGDMDEAMDWEPCQDSDYTFQELESMAVDVLIDSAYIIPDTNVFIDSLVSIKTVIEKECQYKILIPFVVLQELDQLKHRNSEESLSSKASRAIQYIYEKLKAKNPRLQGQKAMEDKSHVIDVTSPDDKVLNCCLQLKNQSKDIILVTNDKNLSNKALLNGIEAITSKQCAERF